MAEAQHSLALVSSNPTPAHPTVLLDVWKQIQVFGIQLNRTSVVPYHKSPEVLHFIDLFYTHLGLVCSHQNLG